MASRRYPENRMPFAPDYGDEVPESWQRFFDLREELLLNYGYNTARAYWADLQDWFDWAVERGKDVLNLTEADQRQYYALLRRRGYSGSTLRRRRTSLRLLAAANRQRGHESIKSPVSQVVTK
jgi:site-specific recombinase XerD